MLIRIVWFKVDSMSMTSPASIAQLAEHALRKRTVVGSIPTGGLLTLSDFKDVIIMVHCLHFCTCVQVSAMICCSGEEHARSNLEWGLVQIKIICFWIAEASCHVKQGLSAAGQPHHISSLVPKSTKLKNDRQSILYLIIAVTLRLDWTGRAVYIFHFGYIFKSCMVGVFVFTLDCNNRI